MKEKYRDYIKSSDGLKNVFAKFMVFLLNIKYLLRKLKLIENYLLLTTL